MGSLMENYLETLNTSTSLKSTVSQMVGHSNAWWTVILFYCHSKFKECQGHEARIYLNVSVRGESVTGLSASLLNSI